LGKTYIYLFALQLSFLGGNLRNRVLALRTFCETLLLFNEVLC
jgi:hypothetical protein